MPSQTRYLFFGVTNGLKFVLRTLIGTLDDAFIEFDGAWLSEAHEYFIDVRVTIVVDAIAQLGFSDGFRRIALIADPSSLH